MTRTKIIASIGPSTSDPKIIKELHMIGVDCFRINFSHGTPDDWNRYIDMIRSVEKEVDDQICILGDLRGPSIRLGELKENISISRGQKIIFSKDPSKGIPIDSDEFFKLSEEGDVLLMDDGRMRFEIISASSDLVEAIALTDGVLSSRKNINIKGKDLKGSILSERDYDAIKISVEKEITYIGVSHARARGDIEIVRRNIRLLGGNQKILAKIENRLSLENLSDIIEASDGVVIARGDLGMSIGLEEVPHIQERIVRESKRRGRPVILATQLLESMIRSPIPTRSEVQDIYNGVALGVDAMMLTGETAVGLYPVEAVKWLKRVIETSEARLSQERFIREEIKQPEDVLEKFLYGVVKLAESIKADIVIFSRSGNSAYKLSVFRPSVKIVCGTNNRDVYKALKILWGVDPVYVEENNYDEGLEKTVAQALDRKLVERGSLVIKSYARPQEDKYVVSVKRLL